MCVDDPFRLLEDQAQEIRSDCIDRTQNHYQAKLWTGGNRNCMGVPHTLLTAYAGGKNVEVKPLQVRRQDVCSDLSGPICLSVCLVRNFSSSRAQRERDSSTNAIRKRLRQ